MQTGRMDTLTLQNIRDCWDDIRPGLEAVRAKIGANWRPEDVYVACVMDQARLYVGETGFIVVQPRIDHIGQPEFFIWIAQAYGEGNIDRFQSSVDALAQEYGYKRLTMLTNRTAFIRMPGWTPVGMLYERTL